jgi:Fe-S-cluster containining protein
VPERDSLDKIVEKYFSSVCREPFEYKGTTYKPRELRVSPLIFRGFQGCMAKDGITGNRCGACCQWFSLDYIDEPDYPMPGGLVARQVKVNGRSFTVYSDMQLDRRDKHFCRHLKMDSGLCGIHKRHPFSCDFELIRFSVPEKHPTDPINLSHQLYGHGFAMRRVDTPVDKKIHGKDPAYGARCEMLPPTEHSVDEVIRRLERLETWATYFQIETCVPDIIEWVRENRDRAIGLSDAELGKKIKHLILEVTEADKEEAGMKEGEEGGGEPGDAKYLASGSKRVERKKGLHKPAPPAATARRNVEFPDLIDDVEKWEATKRKGEALLWVIARDAYKYAPPGSSLKLFERMAKELREHGFKHFGPDNLRKLRDTWDDYKDDFDEVKHYDLHVCSAAKNPENMRKVIRAYNSSVPKPKTLTVDFTKKFIRQEAARLEQQFLTMEEKGAPRIKPAPPIIGDDAVSLTKALRGFDHDAKKALGAVRSANDHIAKQSENLTPEQRKSRSDTMQEIATRAQELADFLKPREPRG